MEYCQAIVDSLYTSATLPKRQAPESILKESDVTTDWEMGIKVLFSSDFRYMCYPLQKVLTGFIL